MVKDIRKGYNWKSSHRFEDIWKEVNFESYKKGYYKMVKVTRKGCN